ncbi:MAG: single-stranded-DNA-specific exonuclease RecJ, partial [Candidatus Taylorbacteria bacterium]
MLYKSKKLLNEEEQQKLLQFSPLLAHILFHRGIDDALNAEKFLNPDYEMGVHDPFLLKDAEKSAERIVSAIQKGEKIGIYSDYDADGIPGAAIFNDFFKRIGYANYVIYIPHRHDEGFGLNLDAVKELADKGVRLLISIDCGITDVSQVKLANELGMQVIITDHHEPPAELPPAYAIIDHKQLDCDYPDKNLCGSGVAFKLIQAILEKNRFGLKEGVEKWLLDLVGIATLSDMVPLVGENRIFAYYGLAVLRKSPRKGLIQLLKTLNINQRYLNEDDIAFMVTPRINAASRMGDPEDAFKMLAADNDTDAYSSVKHLDKINNERKGVVASLVKEVKKILHTRFGNIESPIPAVIVLGNPDWRPSLLGLVANTCAEEYDRPVFLWGRDGDNVIKGSCRSEGKTNIVELMRAVPANTFGQFGGHKHSGGFSVANDQIHFLEKSLNDAQDGLLKGKVKEKVGGEASDEDVVYIDAELSIDEINERLFSDLNRLAPFGVGNPKPVFMFRNIAPISVRKFGKTSNHVELVFKQLKGMKVPAIAFFGAENEWMKFVSENRPIDMV